MKNEAEAFKVKGNIIKKGPYKLGYSYCLGSKYLVPAEKAIATNASAVREWDSNGTVFGYNPNIPGH